MNLRNRAKRIPGLAAANKFMKEATHAMRVAAQAPLSRFVTACPPGSFYSPLPSPDDIPESVSKDAQEIAGVDLRESAQIALLHELAKHYADFAFFPEQPDGKTRFYLMNEYYSWCDAIVLFTMMRHFRPRRIIEVGSGFSSSVMLDTRDRFGGGAHFTFIDPNPERLHSLLRADDASSSDVIEHGVQEVPLDRFEALEANDILFVDSSHVVKVRSDVAFIVFNVLPRLQSGVVIHFHDIPWPFEYPVSWLREGRAWNEAYFLRSFLQYNDAFEILFFNDMMTTLHADEMRELMPAALKRIESNELLLTASSLWLRKR
jgi:predicted O-methyltransferase YrrM